jgi:hypothetical protein
MATVGYGDVFGTNTAEKYCCILMMVVGVIYFSLVSGSVASMMDSIDKN